MPKTEQVKLVTADEIELLILELQKHVRCQFTECDGGIFSDGLTENPTIWLALFPNGDHLNEWPLNLHVTIGPEGSTWMMTENYSTIDSAVEATRRMGAILRRTVETVSPRRCADCSAVIPNGQQLCNCNTSGDLG